MNTFGERIEGIEYVDRPGAYAIIERDGAIAVVMTPSGTHLPGGGIDPGESSIDAVLREVREECGFDIGITRELGEADEYMHDVVSGVHYLKLCRFYAAHIRGNARYECEPDHELVWLSPDDAIALLTHASQRWAVAAWATPPPAPPR